MKKLFFALFLALGTATISLAQTPTMVTKTAPGNTASAISFAKTTFDYGTLPQGIPANADFEFTNTGKSPVILTNVQGSCGCTVPSWPKEPIMPGKKAKISAQYNAAAVGSFSKTITVTTNETGMTPIILTIKGTVAEKKAEGTNNQ